jgi:hypothetical protein
MMYVHKQSAVPVQPWGALRRGGVNNLLPAPAVKYLVLWNVDIIHRDGSWHYIYEFDARPSLAMSSLAQLTHTSKQPTSYPGEMNWREWLGQGWEVVSAAMREQIMSLPSSDPWTDATITDMRELPAGSVSAKPHVPGRFNMILPPNYMLALA